MDEQTKKAIAEAKGEIEEVKQILLQKSVEKGAKTLLESINKSFIKNLNVLTGSLGETVKFLEGIAKESHVDKKEILEAVKNIKLEPKIDIHSPEIKVPSVEIPSIKIPEIKVPRPSVTVQPPDIHIPPAEVKIKEIKITGFTTFVKALFTLLKGKFNVTLTGVDRDNPLPVILTDPATHKFYKAMAGVIGGMMGGGGRTRVAHTPEIENLTLTSANTTYSYAIPDDTLSMIVKMRGYKDLLYSWSDFGEYITIPSAASKLFQGIWFTGKTIYFRCGSAGQIVEIECLKE